MVVSWATYFGGTANEEHTFVTVASNGDALVAGSTSSASGISSSGAYQENLSGEWDAFLARFNSEGELVWSTYFGGVGNEFPWNVQTGSDGNIYLFGQTSSQSGLSVGSVHQSAFGGGPSDGFVAKFSSGGQLLWATYFGGEGFEESVFGSIDNSGNVTICGTTNSLSQIATPSAHQTSFGGFADVFVAKINPSGQLIWSTYLGGAGDDTAFGCTTGSDGTVYVTGRTNSTTSIATVGSYQSVYPNSGNGNPFLVKFSSSGVREWGTYYGGADGLCVCTDNDDNVYMTGLTQGGFGSYHLIPTVGAHQEVSGSNGDDAFLVKFNAAGTRLWGTFYGGNGQDEGHSCTTDGEGSVYVSGRTGSTDAIATVGAHQGTFGGDFGDGFVAKFSSDGQREWGTYFGGAGYDIGLSVSTSSTDVLYLSGKTQSTNSISTASALQPTNNGNTDGFIAKFVTQSPVSTDLYSWVDELKFYPNPASQSLYVNTSKGNVVEIWSMDGRCILRLIAEQSIEILDVSLLENGVYLISENSLVGGKIFVAN